MTRTSTTSDRVMWVELWDGRHWPGRVVAGTPVFRYGQAPCGLLTRRQLRAKGLAPGGQEPFAALTWRRGRRSAWLYVEAYARPKRQPTPAQLDAIGKALAARMVCVACGPVDHCVRRTDQLCGGCYAGGVRREVAA